MSHRSLATILSLSTAPLALACGGTEPQPVAPTPPRSTSAPPGATVAPPATSTTASTATAATPAPPTLSPPIDEKAVADATGVEKPENSPDGVVKASWPRKDVDVAIDGWKIPPFMGLTSWAGFSPGRQGVAEAMVMGDLVLFEDEVNPIMSKLLDGGVQVTALHNHFFYDAPHVFFMHIGGEGKVADLGKTVRAAMEEAAAIRKKDAEAVDDVRCAEAAGEERDRRKQARCSAPHEGTSQGGHVQGHVGARRDRFVRMPRRQGYGGQHVGCLRGQ